MGQESDAWKDSDNLHELAGDKLSAGAQISKGEDLLSSLGLGHLLANEDDDVVNPFHEGPSGVEGEADDLEQPAVSSSDVLAEGRNDS